jgi:membrane associated rhomboid family serine protease
VTAQGSEPSERSPWARPSGDASTGDASTGEGASVSGMAWSAPRTQDPSPPDHPWAGGPPAGGPLPPTGGQTRCYRHPGREAFVACQRCGRPICPDCMRPASVGFHCPEEGSAVSRAARTALGGRVQPGSSGLVTRILVGLCVLAYILQGLPGLARGQTNYNSFYVDYSLYGAEITAHHQYYRLLTAAFLHASPLHILLNMYALYLMGVGLEAMLGRVRYIALFVICAVGGSTLSYLVNGNNTLSVGASTAIFGFFAAYYLVARRLRINTSQILIVVAINLGLSFTVSQIDKWGHIGGLLTGLVMGLIFAYIPPRRAALQAVCSVAVLAALVAAVVVHAQSLPVVIG